MKTRRPFLPFIYISGPMTGHDDLNYPSFFAAEKRWEDWGWNVLNPARNPDQPSRADYMRLDYEALLQVDAIALLPGWQDSEGALSELNMARELYLDVMDAVTGLPLDTWVSLVGGVRGLN